MTSTILFKADNGISQTIELDNQSAAPVKLINREGKRLRAVDSNTKKGTYLAIFSIDEGPEYGKILTITDKTVSGEDYGLPYVESLTHFSHKER